MPTDAQRRNLASAHYAEVQALNERIALLEQQLAEARKDSDRYRWMCATLGQTQLPTLIERITNGYVADYKPSIDAAIDAAITSTQKQT